MTRLVLAAFLAALSFPAQAAIFGPMANCSGTIGATAANVAFPATGTGGTSPQDYLLIQNNSTAAQNIWVSVLPNPTATTAPPSLLLSPTSSVLFSSATAPIPPAVSIIGSAAGAVYTCWYK